MGSIVDHINDAFRDYVTDGIPLSGLHEVEKSDVRAIGPVIEDAIATTSLGTMIDVIKTTRALLDADLAWAADSVALVYADSDDANNDLYIKSGASGSGSWTLTSAFHNLLAAAGVRAAINSVPFATWTALAAATGMAAGDRATVHADDTGSHTDPVVGGTVRNAGVYQYSASPAGWQRVADLDSQVAQALAPTTYETTIPYGALLLLDAGGRIIGQVPDPALAELVATAATTDVFETTITGVAGYILDAGGRIVVELGGTSTVQAEVAAARGNMPSLTARLDSVITADGAPIINPYRPELLRQARYRLTKLALPTRENILMGISAGGDSWTHDASRWVTPFTDELVAKFGDGGMGFTSFGFPNVGNVAPWIVGNQPSFPNGNARPSRYPIRFFGNISSVYYTGKGPDLAMATFSASGDAIEIDFPAGHPNTVGKLLYVAAAGAAARVTTNGGSSWTALDLSAGTAGALTTLSITPPAGAATMRIEWVSGTCEMSGVFARGTTGVYVNKIAATGSRQAQWATASATNWETGFAALEPHLFIAMDGTNSQSAGVSALAWGASTETLVTRARSAVPAIDILIATPAENQRTNNPVPMPAYAVEGRKRAQALRCTFFDTQDLFGDPANPTEYGSSGAIPLFQSDLFHPNAQTGGRSLVSGFLDTIMPFKGV